MATPPPAREAESAPFALPRLPFDLVIDRFVVTDATVSAAVLGRQASFRAEGSLATRGEEKMGLELALTRTDGGESRADLKALYFPPRNRLTLQAEVHEEAGGLLAYLAGVPDLPAIDLSLSGDGPLDHWDGKLALKAGTDDLRDSDIAIPCAAPARAALQPAALPRRLRARGVPPPPARAARAAANCAFSGDCH